MANHEGLNQSENIEMKAKRDVGNLISEIYDNNVGGKETDTNKIVESWGVTPEEKSVYVDELLTAQREMRDGVDGIASIEEELRKYHVIIEQPSGDDGKDAELESKIWSNYSGLIDTLGKVLDGFY